MNPAVLTPAVAFAVSFATLELGVRLALRPLFRSAPAHDFERARLSWPGRVVTANVTLLAPFLWGPVGARAVSDADFGSPRTIAGFLAAATAAFLGCLLAGARGEARFRGRPVPLGRWLMECVAGMLVSGSAVLPPLLLTFVATPWRLDGHAAAVLAGGTAVSLIVILASHRCLAALRFLAPAPPRLATAVEAAVAAGGPRPRAVNVLRSGYANAFAWPLQGAVAVTGAALDVLDDEELAAIAAHELAHLAEPRRLAWLRVLPLAALLPFPAAGALYGTFGHDGPLALLALLAVLMLLRRRLVGAFRRAEETADRAGVSAQAAEQTYARALLAICRRNLIPAVMPGRRHVHPHLYDRLLSAGLTPDFPRPAPPSRRRALAARIAVWLPAIALAAAWLLVVLWRGSA